MRSILRRGAALGCIAAATLLLQIGTAEAGGYRFDDGCRPGKLLGLDSDDGRCFYEPGLPCIPVATECRNLGLDVLGSSWCRPVCEPVCQPVCVPVWHPDCEPVCREEKPRCSRPPICLPPVCTPPPCEPPVCTPPPCEPPVCTPPPVCGHPPVCLPPVCLPPPCHPPVCTPPPCNPPPVPEPSSLLLLGLGGIGLVRARRRRVVTAA